VKKAAGWQGADIEDLAAEDSPDAKPSGASIGAVPEKDDKNKKLAGLRKSTKLKIFRDDFDTSLFVIADKVETDSLVEQELAKLNFSEEWMDKLVPKEGKVFALIKTKAFNGTVTFMIILNVLFVGIESEVALVNAREGEGSGVVFLIVDMLFCCFFVTEIVLRLLGDRIVFIVGPDWVGILWTLALSRWTFATNC